MFKKLVFVGVALLATLGPAQAQVNRVPQLPSQYETTGVLIISNDGQKVTYSASSNGLVAAASATDIWTITGSATKTIKITRIVIGGRATAVANADIVLVKRSAADTGGTSTAPTAVPYDSLQGAATATLAAYTANPTTGTLVGNLGVYQYALGNLTTGVGHDELTLDFGGRAGSKPIILRGAAEQFGINLAGVSYSGNLWDITVEWTEE